MAMCTCHRNVTQYTSLRPNAFVPGVCRTRTSSREIYRVARVHTSVSFSPHRFGVRTFIDYFRLSPPTPRRPGAARMTSTSHAQRKGLIDAMLPRGRSIRGIRDPKRQPSSRTRRNNGIVRCDNINRCINPSLYDRSECGIM